MGWMRTKRSQPAAKRIDWGFGGRCPECGTGLAVVRARAAGLVTGWCPEHGEVESRTG